MEDSPPLKLTATQRGIIISVSLSSFMCLLDAYIVNISLPEIAHHFSVTSGEVVRINLALLLTLTSGLSIWGRLADRFGLKRIFFYGYLLFIVSLTICGFAPRLGWLVAGRSLQGVGISMLIVSSPAFIAKYIPQNHQGSAYGTQATAGSLGLIIGAPLGGIISGYLGWQYIFFVNIPIGLVAAFLALRALPDDPPVESRAEKFDVFGAVLWVSGLLLLITGINSGSGHAWATVLHWLHPLSGILVLVVLVAWERRAAFPLIPLNVFHNRFFLLMTLAFIPVLMTIGGNNFVIPFYLTKELHLSQATSGLLMLAFSGTYGLLSLLMGHQADRHHPALLCMSGMLIGVVAFVFFAATLGRASTLCTAVFLLATGCGFGCFIAPATKMIMGAADKNNAASVAALNRTSMYLASLIGVSLFDLLLGVKGATLEIGNFRHVYIVAPLLPLLALFFSWRAWLARKDNAVI